MPRSFSRLLVLLFVLFVLAATGGCVTVSRQYEGTTLDTEAIARVRVGVTTRQEILDAFGPPFTIQKRDFEGMVSALGSHFQGDELTVRLDPKLLNEVFVYEYRRVNRMSIVLIFYNYLSSIDKSDRLMFFFGEDNTVRGFGFTEGTREL